MRFDENLDIIFNTYKMANDSKASVQKILKLDGDVVKYISPI